MFGDMNNSMQDYDNLFGGTISGVVAHGLCTRCGACFGVCPSESIEFNNKHFPETTYSCSRCGLCLKVCGGIEVNFPKYCQKHYGCTHNLTDNAIGPVLYSEAIYSTDGEVRKKGASGGLASQILISLFDQGRIDGAVVVGYCENNPLQPEVKMARNREDVLSCAQSKYSLFPVAHIYRKIISEPGRYAVVGLPCQIHSLYRWQEISPKLNDRVVLIIGLFCHMNLEFDAVRDLARIKKIPVERISKLEFRGGQWPGGVRITLDDGRVIPLHKGDIKDGAFNYLNKLYAARRCLYCVDFSSELSDIAISDPWLRGSNGDYIFKGGWSVGHVRTKRGHNVIAGMKKLNAIKAEKIDYSLIVSNNQSITHHKKRGAFIRISRSIKKGNPSPVYYYDFPRLSAHDHLRETLYQISMIGWHVKALRKYLLRIAFSKMGWTIAQWKSSLKKMKYRKITSFKAD